MGIYLKDKHNNLYPKAAPGPRKKTPPARWESAQASLQKEPPAQPGLQKEPPLRRQRTQTSRQEEREASAFQFKNSFGRLHYLKKRNVSGPEQEGLALEAFAAPNAPLHTQAEMHLDRGTMKRLSHGDKQNLFAAEVPLRDQALFFDLSAGEKSNSFLAAMEALTAQQGHRTLTDAFGFLDQESEHQKLDLLRENQGFAPAVPQIFAQQQAQINEQSGRLRRKEAQERQLCSDLQLMLDRLRQENAGEHGQNILQPRPTPHSSSTSHTPAEHFCFPS